MNNLLLWYIPQAALFFWGISFARGTDVGGHGATAFGLILAGAYTALIMVLRDAPANWRGLSRTAKRVLIGVLIALVALPIAVGAQSGMALQSLPITGFSVLLWLVIVALWHSFTVKPTRQRQLPSRKQL